MKRKQHISVLRQTKLSLPNSDDYGLGFSFYQLYRVRVLEHPLVWKLVFIDELRLVVRTISHEFVDNVCD